MLDRAGGPVMRPPGLQELEAVLDAQLEDRDPDPLTQGEAGVT